MNISPHSILKIFALGLLCMLLWFALERMPGNMGTVDFRAYWSSSYLMARGENFADDAAVLALQLEKTNTHEDFPIKTWNPPWVLVWLIPYSWLPFRQATLLWLLTNIGALLFAVFASWRLLVEKASSGRWLWVAVAAALLFPSTIVSLMFGQVNLPVLAGLVGNLYFGARKRETAAGVMLALTTFKPHLVYLVLPFLLLLALQQRRWRQLAAFTLSLLLPMGVAFLLRPSVLGDYFRGTVAGSLMQWETATLTTVLSLQAGAAWLRWVGVVLLPLFLTAWWRWGRSWRVMHVTQIGVLVSLITMPFGWSYDFVLLLWPITQTVVWLIELPLGRGERTMGAAALAAIYSVYYWQRIVATNEMVFFWVPLAIAAVYLYYLSRMMRLTTIGFRSRCTSYLNVG